MHYSNNAQAELNAVNEILASIGQAPVSTIEAQTVTYEDGSVVETVINPEVAIAFETLLQVSREVQAEGWSFNKETEYPISPDNDGYINLPGNMLAMDMSDIYDNKQYDTVIRYGKLYDKIQHTDVWEQDTYSVDVVWYLDFVDLPQVFKDYVISRAATRCATRLVGDPQLAQTLLGYEGLRRANCLEYECNEGDYSMFGFKKGEDYYTSYKPFQVLSR